MGNITGSQYLWGLIIYIAIGLVVGHIAIFALTKADKIKELSRKHQRMLDTPAFRLGLSTVWPVLLPLMIWKGIKTLLGIRGTSSD